jgi:EmrB/QacA subfamily drug resistance transporter
MESNLNDQSPGENKGIDGSFNKNIALAVICLGLFLSSVVMSSTGLCLPPISREYGLDIHGASWVMLALLITSTSLLLVMGRAGDIYGHRRLYIAGHLILAVSSLISGVAPDFLILLAGRVLQGFGGAMIFTSSPSIISTTFPAKERGKALGMQSTSVYLGLMLGPPLGGELIHSFGWRSVFLVMVPLAAVIAVLGWRLLPTPKPQRDGRMDFKGALALVTGLPFLLIALNQGQSWGWTAPRTYLLALSGISVVVYFLVIQARSDDPLLDLGLFRSRMFTGATLSAIANYTALTFSSFLLPFFLVESRGLNSAQAGLILSTQPLMMAVSASPSGWLSDRLGSRGLTFAGMMIMLLGFVGLTFHAATESTTIIAVWLAVLGLGTGIFISPNTNALLGSAPRDKQGIASGVMAFARNFGMLLGTTISALIFHISGGDTGSAWQPKDLYAFKVAVGTAAAISLMGALTSLMRGKRKQY